MQPRMVRASAPLFLALLLTLTASCARGIIGTDEAARTEAEKWARSALDGLTLEEKVSQLFAAQARAFFYNEHDPEYQRLVRLVEDFGIGGIIFSIGQPLTQVLLTNDLQQRAQVPLLITQDMEWGVGMRLERTTTFPRAMAVGATRDPHLAYLMGRAIAEESRALGIHQNYAPVADVNNNPFNPIINVRSFGEDLDLVSSMVVAYTKGMEDGGLISTAKHFPGHGDTEVDSHADLPVLPFGRDRLEAVELVPFRAAIEAGVSSIMVAHLAFPAIEPDSTVPSTLSKRVVTDILRNDLGFDGLVVSDAMMMEGITKHFGAGEAAIRAIEAGIDQILMSADEYAARAAILRAIQTGRLTEAQIDRAALRILEAKARFRLGQDRLVDPDQVREHVASEPTLALRNEIARRSLTLLRNENDLFPLLEDELTILNVTLSDNADPDEGRAFADLLGRYGPTHTVTHRLLDTRSKPEDFEAVLKEADAYDVILVPTYLQVRAWSGEIGLPEGHQRFLNRLIALDPPVALLSFGNPYMVLGLDEPDVYVAAYGASEATLQATAQAIYGQSGFSGELPVNIPGHYEAGTGIDLPQLAPRRALPEEAGMSGIALLRVDSLLRTAIAHQAFPGAAVAVGRSNALVKSDGYGYFTYTSEQHVTPSSLFDLASLTKVIATTTAVMKLYEADRIDLDAPLAAYVQEFGRHGKDRVTIRQILTHTAGLTPYHRFYEMDIRDPDTLLKAIYDDTLQAEPGTRYRYSDLGMIVLAEAVARITGQPFEAYTRTEIFEPLGMRHTGYRPLRGVMHPVRPAQEFVVPTEIDPVFRRRLVQGEVHDENAWILGGVAGHAGLFSTVEDLSKFAQMLLNWGMHHGRQFLKPETIKLFSTRVPSTLDHTRALGWDTRAPEGYSSAGEKFGPKSFGHTGFTGTSLWIDPDADLFVILLTNRVYPTRNNGKHVPIRAALADFTFDAVRGPSTLWYPVGQN